MLNFRKLKHDFSPAILKEGKALFDKDMVISIKIINLKPDAIRFSSRVMGSFDNCYESELEIDSNESIVVDSDCDCSYKYDCQHLAAILYYLESNYDQILVAYSKETDLEKDEDVNDFQKEHLRVTLKEAETKEHLKRDKKVLRELLQEYIYASQVLGQSSFFRPEEEMAQDKAELAVLFTLPQNKSNDHFQVEFQLSLRLPFRSKPLNITQISSFLDSVRYQESIYIGNKRYFFSLNSFDEASAEILKMIIDFARFSDVKGEKQQRTAFIDVEAFGSLLAVSHSIAETRLPSPVPYKEQEIELLSMPCIYCGTIEEPLKLAINSAVIRFEMNYLEVPNPKILLKPKIVVNENIIASCEEVLLFECAKPGLVYHNTYYRFQTNVKRKHLRNLSTIRDMTIPEPLFGTFVENGLPELMRFSEVSIRKLSNVLSLFPSSSKSMQNVIFIISTVN